MNLNSFYLKYAPTGEKGLSKFEHAMFVTDIKHNLSSKDVWCLVFLEDGRIFRRSYNLEDLDTNDMLEVDPDLKMQIKTIWGYFELFKGFI